MMGPEIPSPPDLKVTHPLPPSPSSPSTHRPTAGDDTLLDPPSYADAIFRPADPITAGNSTSSYLEITVTNPHKENSNSFTTYLITTRVRGAPSPSIVRRRFRHVVALADRLAESYRGYFIPIRPDKSVVRGPEFVEQRRDDLERYLRRIVAHPVVGCGEEIRAFLRSEDFGDGEFGDGVAARGGRDLMRVFRELRRSVANDWGGAKGVAEEEDEGFLERKGGWVGEFGLRLNATSEQVLGLEIVVDLAWCLDLRFRVMSN